MSYSRPAPGRRPLAVWRTDLLRRMLLVRHFTEHAAPVPIAGHELCFRSGEEAVAAGAWAALGPADVLLPAGEEFLRNPDAGWADTAGRYTGPGAAVIFLLPDQDVRDASAALAAARRRRLPVLLCQEYVSGSAAPAAVDGRDVEVVWTAVRERLRAPRTAGPYLLGIHTGDTRGWADPVAILAARMYADHQLDANALRAIDSGTAQRVETLLAMRGGIPQRREPAVPAR